MLHVSCFYPRHACSLSAQAGQLAPPNPHLPMTWGSPALSFYSFLHPCPPWLQDLLKHKLIFIETQDVVETTLALDNFRRACDCGRGAIFFRWGPMLCKC